MMDRILGNLKWTVALVYIDDLLVYAKDFAQLTERFEMVLERCEEFGLTFIPS